MRHPVYKKMKKVAKAKMRKKGTEVPRRRSRSQMKRIVRTLTNLAIKDWTQRRRPRSER